jgi:hypothetical protein
VNPHIESPLRSPANTQSVALEPIATTGHRIESQIRGCQDLVEHGADGKRLKAGPQLVLPIESFGQTAQRTGRLLEGVITGAEIVAKGRKL